MEYSHVRLSLGIPSRTARLGSDRLCADQRKSDCADHGHCQITGFVFRAHDLGTPLHDLALATATPREFAIYTGAFVVPFEMVQRTRASRANRIPGACEIAQAVTTKRSITVTQAQYLSAKIGGEHE
jgi:hypothetical protein